MVPLLAVGLLVWLPARFAYGFAGAGFVPRSAPPLGLSAITGLSVSATSSAAGATQDRYKVKFTATSAIPSSSGYIQLTAPAGTVFSTYNGNYDVIDAGNHAYPSQVVVSPGGAGNNVVDVYLSSGFPVNAGDSVEVDAYTVANPAGVVSTGKFLVSTSSDATPVSVSFPIGNPTAITALSSAVSSPTAGATGVTYTIGLGSTHGLSSCNPDACAAGQVGFVQLTAAGGAVFPTSNSDYTVADGSNSGTAASVTVGPGGAGTNVADVYIPASLPVNAGDQLTVTVTNVTNPPNVGNGPVSVKTSSDATAASAATPTAVKAYAGTSKAAVSWTAPAAHISAITDYIVVPYIGTTAQTPIDTHSVATSALLTGLTQNTKYTFKIEALDTAGYGPMSVPSSTVTVAGPAAKVSVAFSPRLIRATGTSTTTATATVKDAFGNKLALDTISFSSSDPGERIGAVTDKHNGTYIATVTSSTTPQKVTITATDSSVTPTVSGQGTLIQFGPAKTITVGLNPTSIPANGTSTSTATATVKDVNGNPVTGDHLTFTSSDTGEVISTVVDHHNGTYTVTITSSTTPGSPTITATDTSVTPNISGNATLTQT